MYFYQNNVISDAELHALGLSTLAGACHSATCPCAGPENV